MSIWRPLHNGLHDLTQKHGGQNATAMLRQAEAWRIKERSEPKQAFINKLFRTISALKQALNTLTQTVPHAQADMSSNALSASAHTSRPARPHANTNGQHLLQLLAAATESNQGFDMKADAA